MESNKERRERELAALVDLLLDGITAASVEHMPICPEPGTVGWDNYFSATLVTNTNKFGKEQLYYHVQIKMAVPEKLEEPLRAWDADVAPPAEGVAQTAADDEEVPPIERAIKYLSYLLMWLDGSQYVAPDLTQWFGRQEAQQSHTMLM